MRVSIPKDIVVNKPINFVLEIDGNPIVSITLINDHDSLYYRIYDEADLDEVYLIEGHLPEYFEKKAG